MDRGMWHTVAMLPLFALPPPSGEGRVGQSGRGACLITGEPSSGDSFSSAGDQIPRKEFGLAWAYYIGSPI